MFVGEIGEWMWAKWENGHGRNGRIDVGEVGDCILYTVDKQYYGVWKSHDHKTTTITFCSRGKEYASIT
jgi:hypothetical protein